MERNSILFRFLTIPLLVVAMSSCSGKLLVPFSTWIEANVVVSSDVNPDGNGRPSPIVVRLYELSDPTEFQGKEFFDLYDMEGTAMAKTMITKEEYSFRPGESKLIERKLKDETTYVGFIAAFRNIDDARWQGVVKLNKNRTNRISLDLQGINIAIKDAR